MPDVLIYADTLRTPELRHEIPAGIIDPFLYVEHDGGRHAVIGQLDADSAVASSPGLQVVPPEELGLDELLASGMSRDDAALEIAVRACERLGVGGAAVPPGFPLALADRLRAGGVELEVERDLFLDRRRAKTPAQLAGIRRAQEAADAAMEAAAELMREAEPVGGGFVVDGEPLTSELVKAAIFTVFSEYNTFTDDCIVSHGPQTAVGHHMGSGEILAGEPIVIDIWPADRATGCYSDMTRTFVLGKPEPKLLEWHALSREALARAVEAVRPGVTGFEIFELVSEIFSANGHPTQLTKKPGEVLRDGFFHGLGHGVGLEVHEAPALGRTGSAPLVAGDVVAIEPGTYRQGYGGCRIEDLVLVTEDGPEVLTSFRYELTP